MDTETTLTFWTWVPDIEQEVALFEKAYPEIKVEVVNVGQGGSALPKLRTALQAGQGAPDVAQMEFQYIPSFTLTTSLLDLRPYGRPTSQVQFVDWTWTQVSGPTARSGATRRTPARWACSTARTSLRQHGIEPPEDLGRVRRRGRDATRRQEPERAT